MPPPRPRGVGYNSGSSSTRPSTNAPMSERQQMALLIQMTAANSTSVSRSHSKKNDHKKVEEVEEVTVNEKDGHDHAKDKNHADDSHADSKKDSHSDHAHGHGHGPDGQSAANAAKRNFSDMDEDDCEECDDVKKKKRKDSDSSKESKTMSNLRVPGKVERNTKQTSATKTPQAANKNQSVAADKEHADNAKSSLSKGNFDSNADDDDDLKMTEVYSGGLKVPPLKIVIPQQNSALDTDGVVSRTGKVNTSRNAALPYVVSSNNEGNDREGGTQCTSPNESPQKPTTSAAAAAAAAAEEKHVKLINEEKNLHRVLRSSHRQGGIERSSNNSSPQMQSSSPSPASSNHNETAEGKGAYAAIGASPSQPPNQSNYEQENIANMPSPSTSSTSSSKDVHAAGNVELHPRKRKIRSKNDDSHLKASSGSGVHVEPSSTVSDNHPHDFPFTNCFQMYLNIRRQIENKWKNLYAIKPRPPQGYNEYLINKKSYLLYRGRDGLNIHIPRSISSKMRDIFIVQERERKELIQRHTVEREKLCLNVEQEIIRVHSKAARNISCQSIPYSVCTLLKDEEVYNIITPEQEEKDRSARHRFNGRLLLSWLQDVDDKWEKIKESMLLRHHNEAESLHAVQLMDWEIALKKFRLCDFKTQITIDSDHVPIVHVSDDFDLLPA